MEEWNFENRGVKYWSQTPEFRAYMNTRFDDLIEKCLTGPCRIADILPRQVPADSEGQYFAAEGYFTEPGRLAGILKRHGEILLRLNCYYDMEATFDGGDSWEKNPVPEAFVERVAALSAGGFLRVVFPSEEAMIDIDSGDTWATVYGGDEAFQETVRALFAAEGLFVWEPGKEA